jgi:hypothetical protein
MEDLLELWPLLPPVQFIRLSSFRPDGSLHILESRNGIDGLSVSYKLAVPLQINSAIAEFISTE